MLTGGHIHKQLEQLVATLHMYLLHTYKLGNVVEKPHNKKREKKD